MKNYDYVIVGAGLYGACFAYLVKQAGKKCLVIDKRSHQGGNLYCDKVEDINVHNYGPHIFHTDNKECWDFVNTIAEFNHFVYSPLARYKDLQFNLPFNMNTFYQLWRVRSPKEAMEKIESQRNQLGIKSPCNLEEQALSMVGVDIYNTLVKGYTEKQWGRSARELPAFIIKRLPLRYTYNNNYFNDRYQGIPIGGYNVLISNLLKDIEVRTNTDYLENRRFFDALANRVIYTGRIDEFMNYQFGKLEYRSLKFETEVLECENYQGTAAVNYTDRKIPYTRIVEHKHFEFGTQESTVITREYPADFNGDNEPYYPINDDINNKRFLKYKEMALLNNNVQFGGRLGDYSYYDMDDTILAAMQHARIELKN